MAVGHRAQYRPRWGRVARADEDDAKPANTGNWFTHLFAKDSAKKKGADAKKTDAPPAPSAADIRQKAQAEWLRRQEVCDKLRAIALECGDKDLARKADALDQRAWDLYVLRTGSTKMNASADEQFPDDQPIRGAASSAQQTGKASNSASTSVDGRTASRKE